MVVVLGIVPDIAAFAEPTGFPGVVQSLYLIDGTHVLCHWVLLTASVRARDRFAVWYYCVLCQRGRQGFGRLRYGKSMAFGV